MVGRRSIVSFGFLLLLLFESTLEKSEPLSSHTERTALLDLRSSLGLRSRDWPRKAEPCSSWRGVRCLNGRVIGLNISGFPRTRLSRQNPQFAVNSLANLTLLSSFNASNFLLPGAIPDWFGFRMAAIQVLDLRSCSVNGAIPSSLGNLTNLTSLYLSKNNLTGKIPVSLGRLLRLSILDLSGNSLNGSIPASIASLGNLSFLDLSSNNFTGSIPPGIGTLVMLQYLNLSGNTFSSSIPAQFGDLQNLGDLDLSFNTLSGSVPEDFKGLRNLQNMRIGENLLGGSLPVDLFATLTQLQSLVLRHNGFTGSLPDVLWSMPDLRLLDVSGNNFTGMLPNSSNTNAISAVLNISQNMFYGGLTPSLKRFSSIDLSGNYFKGSVPDHARSNASLDSNCLQNVSSQRTLAECSSFYAERGLNFDNFGLPNSAQPSDAGNSRKSNRTTIILAAVFGGLGFVLLVMLFILLVARTRKRGATNQRGVGVGPVLHKGSEPPPGLVINFSSLGDTFTYQQLLQATGDFSKTNLIKHGHSGDLFRGVLENGINVVIKRIDLRTIKKEAYLLELDFFSKTSHTRLVPFLGHCLENEHEKFLIYKFMPNGDLSNSLYRNNSSDDDGLLSLDWITRLKIAIGAAESLCYLHHECTPPLVHRDVQASSILLDDKFEVRLGSLIFDFSTVVNEPADMHYPVVEMATRSKLSCLSWNNFTKNHIASSDYEGIVTVWDVITRQSVMEYEEHEKRAWSVDFSRTEPSMLVSGSDDYKVKVWCTKQEASVLNIDMKANICCVKYNPGSSNYIAVGSADHQIHYYDLRNISHPLHVFSGHRKAVSYVKFLSNNELASASTDSTLRLWDVKENLPVRTFRGHTNEKNFVGLTVNSEYIACGSETNEVYVYHKEISRPVTWHKFSSPDSQDADDEVASYFISAVCWKSDSPTMLTANSQGTIKVLVLAA